MSSYTVTLYSHGDSLPVLPGGSFFHSAELFHIIGKSRGQRPFMAVATDAEGHVVGHMLALIRNRSTWLPPFLYMQGRIFGEGEYADDEHREEIFGLLLRAMTRKLRRKLCFYIEFSDISRKMFGYRLFKQNGYFPIGWQIVYNSLHSRNPEERLSEKLRLRIHHIYDLGVETREVRNEEELHAFYKLLNGFTRFKMRRIIPPEEQVRKLDNSDSARVFITLWKGRVIGGSLCIFSEGNAYLWYLASRRKSFTMLHPDVMTIWHALHWSWEHHYAHFFFLDVGLPVPRSPYRDFILSFGGKPVSSYRWFRFTSRWLNRFFAWFYRE